MWQLGKVGGQQREAEGPVEGIDERCCGRELQALGLIRRQTGAYRFMPWRVAATGRCPEARTASERRSLVKVKVSASPSGA